MEFDKYLKLICDALEDVKALDIKVIDVKDLTSVTDVIIIASGTSNRHVKALSSNLLEQAAKHRIKPLGVEGEREGEWILVDLGDVVVHVMQPDVRAFYNLEKLWDKDLLEAKPSNMAKTS